MSSSRVPDCLLICPHCPPSASGRPRVVRFGSEHAQARCPGCRRWYRVTTRVLAEATRQTPLPIGGSRYRLVTTEARGRPLVREFVASPGLRLAIGEKISLVRHGGRLIGVANQSSGTWFAVTPRREPRGMRGLEWLILAICAVLGLGLLAMVGAAALASPGAALIAGICLASVAAPLVIDLISADPGAGPGQKGSGPGPRA